jgi:SAM-dependent methyltransferase
MTQMMQSYEALYAAEKSQRFQNEGWIGVEYRLPKYLSYFFRLYGHLQNLSVLELGAGNGEMHELIMKDPRSREMIGRYVTSEYSAAGVDCMRKKNIESYQGDACRLTFPDNSFDLVIAFDVMHHVHAPSEMGAEMVRVSKKYFFLCEANGISILRKLNELRPSLKAFGENSYSPWRYRSFFPKERISSIRLKPFYCFVVPKCPRPLIPFNRALSEVCERLPAVNWQGLSVLIHGEKKSTNG